MVGEQAVLRGSQGVAQDVQEWAVGVPACSEPHHRPGGWGPCALPLDPPPAHRQQLTLLSPLHADLAPPGLAESPRETAQTLVKSLSSSGCVQYPGCCWARMCLQELKGTGISWGKRGKRPRKESLGGGGWQRTGKVCLSTEDGSDVPGGSRSVGLRSGPRGGLQIEQAYLEHS